MALIGNEDYKIKSKTWLQSSLKKQNILGQRFVPLVHLNVTNFHCKDMNILVRN